MYINIYQSICINRYVYICTMVRLIDLLFVYYSIYINGYGHIYRFS
jgi:hypothetical protein